MMPLFVCSDHLFTLGVRSNSSGRGRRPRRPRISQILRKICWIFSERIPRARSWNSSRCRREHISRDTHRRVSSYVDVRHYSGGPTCCISLNLKCDELWQILRCDSGERHPISMASLLLKQLHQEISSVSWQSTFLKIPIKSHTVCRMGQANLRSIEYRSRPCTIGIDLKR